MTTIKQIQKQYPSYEITKCGKRNNRYQVTPFGQETWADVFYTLADVEQAIAIVEGDRVQKNTETSYSHSLTDSDPDAGQYKVTIKQGEDHYEEETFNSKSEAIAYADHLWETMSDVSIVDIVYLPEESESEESEEIQDSDPTIEILRANDSDQDPWVYVVFKNNQQTQFTIQSKNEARSLWGVFEGDRLCYDIYGIDCAISYVTGLLDGFHRI